MLLLIQTYTQARDTLLRHWEFFKGSGANEIHVITTEDDTQDYPATTIHLGKNSYIDGSHLPTRLVETVQWGLNSAHDHILVAEYDVLFLCPIRYKAMEHGVASHRAGSKTWNSLANSFYHPPWLFKREVAEKFVEVGKQVIAKGVCTRNRGEPSTPESSPDVFFGYVTEIMEQPVQEDLWTEYSQHTIGEFKGQLEQAREARKNGVTCIHGVKTKEAFNYIMDL